MTGQLSILAVYMFRNYYRTYVQYGRPAKFNVWGNEFPVRAFAWKPLS
jgi:hypothetical protein